MKNANAVHSEVMKHEINWEDSTVVDREMRVMERKIKENILIKRIRSYNLYSGYPLSPVWDSIIRDIYTIVYPFVTLLVNFSGQYIYKG